MSKRKPDDTFGASMVRASEELVAFARGDLKLKVYEVEPEKPKATPKGRKRGRAG